MLCQCRLRSFRRHFPAAGFFVAPRASSSDLVDFAHFKAGVHQSLGQLAVAGDEQESTAVEIQSADGLKGRWQVGEVFPDGVAAFGVAAGAEAADGFVEKPGASLGLGLPKFWPWTSTRSISGRMRRERSCITSPLTFTFPWVTRPSTSRLEPRPASAKNRLMRSSCTALMVVSWWWRQLVALCYELS